MPVSGLVLTLSSSNDRARDEAMAWLESDERFSLGDSQDAHRFPLTLDTPDRDADKACWQELQSHRGIEFVDVVCVFFS